MRLLLDACVWGQARRELEQGGCDVVWAGDWDEDPGDEAILARAFRDTRILVTLDKDFGELAVVRGSTHAGIVRLVGYPARQQAKVCLEVLRRYHGDLLQGALITVQPGRVRLRPGPSAST